ncbi:MAG: hypothetical protein ACK5CH_01365 [Bacteroidota bacterium]|jgi:porphobilinogen deaminase
MKLKTGVTDNKYSDSIRSFFERNKVDTEVIALSEVQDYAGALHRGDVQAVAMPLDETPFFDQTDLVIAALSNRSAPGYSLLVRRESYDPSQVLKIRKGGIIYTDSLLFTALLKEIRPDTECSMTELGSDLKPDAFCVPENKVYALTETADFEKIVLNPFEFPPRAGSGVMAIVCMRDDMETRRQLREVHQGDISVCTNVERSIVKGNEKYREYTGAYCERDSNGYYHACAVFASDTGIHRARASSSTHAGLAAELAKKIYG